MKIKKNISGNFIVKRVKTNPSEERHFRVLLDLDFPNFLSQKYSETQIMESILKGSRWFTGEVNEKNEVVQGEKVYVFLSTKANQETSDNLNNLPVEED